MGGVGSNCWAKSVMPAQSSPSSLQWSIAPWRSTNRLASLSSILGEELNEVVVVDSWPLRPLHPKSCDQDQSCRVVYSSICPQSSAACLLSILSYLCSALGKSLV